MHQNNINLKIDISYSLLHVLQLMYIVKLIYIYSKINAYS